MTENTYTDYTCDLCGSVYENKDDCIKCENSHITEFKIVDYEFPTKGAFPSGLLLEFEADGEKYTVSYYKER